MRAYALCSLTPALMIHGLPGGAGASEEEPACGSVQEQARVAAMRMASPAFIPRNHLVEAALDAAMRRQDFGPFEELLGVVIRPYEDKPGLERYATPARPDECVLQTFCGT